MRCRTSRVSMSADHGAAVKRRPGTPHERGRRVAAESQLHEGRAEGVRWAHRREGPRDTKLQIAPT